MSDASSQKLAVGIDLGTTNCALAYIEIGDGPTPPSGFGVPQVVHPGEVRAQPLLPSFLYLPSKVELPAGALALPWDPNASETVGELARTQGAGTPSRVISSAKSWLSFAGVDRRASILPWGAPDEVPRLSPLDASARFLSHLRAAWDAAHPNRPLAEQDVVLTVPASFDAVARELTVEAAARAGLPESTRLLEEPQAALYAWLADRGAQWRHELNVGDVLLVCDIGGGTTDFSLIAVREADGALQLERVAVGEHILLGGDNMDLALAYAVRARLEKQGTHLDDWQMRALTHSCRSAKEALLGDAALNAHPLVIPGRGSRLVGGTIRAELTRADVESLLIDGFFPEVDAEARPEKPRRLGLTSIGLPYASDPGVTRHLAAFLGRSSLPRRQTGHGLAHPTAILFNGGVTRSTLIRERIYEVLSNWARADGAEAPRILEGIDPDLAVSRGAAHYARVRRQDGVRIRGGTAQAYYVGVEHAELAVPGIPPRFDALCVAPFGMEEGSEAELAQPFGLVLGEPVSFRFFCSATRRRDGVGTVAEPAELTELSPIESTLEGDGAGEVVAQVRLHARVTEVGTLELAAIDQASGRRWKLSFNVRVE